MNWSFKKLTPNDTRVNATHLEFFRDEALASPVDALVREDIQNRLDAKAAGEDCVKVVYRFRSNLDCVPSSKVSTWLEGLRPHLQAREAIKELDTETPTTGSMPCLVLEDFGTTGLEGDPNTTSDPEDAEGRNDFYWFVRNVGRSGKKGSDRGRWGLGKIVYPAASAIRSFYALTARRSDGRELLVGRSVLAVHRIDGEDFDSEGYFGRFDDEIFHSFCTPTDDAEILCRFKKDFGLKRGQGEPGLSLVIPFPLPEITACGIAQSVIHHYFEEIIRGRLEVLVEDDLGFALEIRDESLEEAVAGLAELSADERSRLLDLIAFGRKALAFEPSAPDAWIIQSATHPSWADPEALFSSPEQALAARAAFRDGRLLRFDIPIEVATTSPPSVAIGHFSVILQRTEASAQPFEVFIRDGLTISGLKVLREPGVSALTRIENNPLSNLLGDAENPAHTTWLQTTKHFRGKYRSGAAVLKYVKNAASALADWLGRVDTELDPDLLQHLFSVPLNDGANLPKPKTKPGDKPPVKPGHFPPKRSSAFRLTECIGGFTIRATGEVVTLPERIRVRVAYETLRGNPFRQHHPADFDFLSDAGDLKITGTGVKAYGVAANILDVKPESPDFELTVVGFDTHRDLVVKARSMPSPDSEQDAEPLEVSSSQ
jgi:hypothetical protein